VLTKLKLMKNIIQTIALIICTGMVSNSTAQSIVYDYAGIVRNADGRPVGNATISLHIRVRNLADFNNVIYEETQCVVTNSYGTFKTVIGNGEVIKKLSSENANARFVKIDLAIVPQKKMTGPLMFECIQCKKSNKTIPQNNTENMIASNTKYVPVTNLDKKLAVK
jgi:hypothetical protein